MRLLAVAKDSGDGMELVCVLSIRDNVRKEAVDAIKQVRKAGIQVVMVTGDRKETAVAIAKEAGLISSPDDVAMTSQEMAEKTDDELKAILCASVRQKPPRENRAGIESCCRHDRGRSE